MVSCFQQGEGPGRGLLLVENAYYESTEVITSRQLKESLLTKLQWFVASYSLEVLQVASLLTINSNTETNS